MRLPAQSDPRRVALSTAYVVFVLAAALALAVIGVVGMGMDW
jgi:hypothetical protein